MAIFELVLSFRILANSNIYIIIILFGVFVLDIVITAKTGTGSNLVDRVQYFWLLIITNQESLDICMHF